MYEEHARPMPLPVGSFLNLSFQPEPRTTCSMQRPRPMVPTRSQLAVSELGGTRCLSRSSAGSSPSCSAILSSWTSSANRASDHLLDAAAEAHGADAQPVGGERVGRDQMPEPELGGIEPELLGDLVELDLEREPRLRRAVATLGSARWFVREGACALKLVPWHLVRDGLQCARVIRARNAVGPVAAAVEQRSEVHAGDGAVLLHSRLHPHQRRVTPAVAVEHF